MTNECRQRKYWRLGLAAVLLVAACDQGDKGADDTLAVGDLYPALSVSDCAGAPVALQSWIGAHDVVYLSFAAGWCQSCQEEAPRIEAELVAGLEGKNVGVAQILMESNDPGTPPTTALCTAWKTELNVSYDVFADIERLHLEPIFGGDIANLPVHIIVTRDGVVRYKRVGALPDDIQQLVTDWLP